MTIGKRIREAREAKHYKQEYVAEQLGVSRQAVSKWETDTTEPDTKNLIALASLLEMSVDELVGVKPRQEKRTGSVSQLLFKLASIFWVISMIVWMIGFCCGCGFPFLDLGSGGVAIWFLLFDTRGINLLFTIGQWVSLLIAAVLFVVAFCIND